VGDPQLQLAGLPADGAPLEFSIEIGVLPNAQLGDYAELEVPRREPAVSDEELDAQIEALRERLARLHTVERPAAEGDFVVVDYRGNLLDEGAGSGAGEPLPGGEARDQLIELGGGHTLEELERGLLGAGAGDTRTIEVSFPPGHSSPELAGRRAALEVTVKEVKLKQLPELDEDFAVDAGFDTLEELREDVRSRLLELDGERVEGEFREAALDALVDGSRVDLTPELVKARAREMWERMLHSLGHRGISREAYLKVTGREEDAILAELEPDADRALRREAVLTALVDAEGISPTDEELAAELAPLAEREGLDAGELIERLRSGGRLEDAREDLAARRAVELIAERARAISPAAAHAREKLWTPEQALAEEEAARGREPAPAGGPSRLWTPTDRT
jgi:trigger factor